MVMTSVSGHLLSLDFAAAYKNWSVLIRAIDSSYIVPECWVCDSYDCMVQEELQPEFSVHGRNQEVLP